jgi:hypothetical protein
MRQLKSVVPVIIVLVVVLAGSVGFGMAGGSDPQNEQALLAALNIMASENTAVSSTTPGEALAVEIAEKPRNGKVASADLIDSENGLAAASEPEGYYFVYNQANVRLGYPMAEIVEGLGQEIDFYSYPSCFFDGDEKVYIYDGFEIASYMRDLSDIDRLYSITFLDDRVATVEGLHIGQSYEEMVGAYGREYEEIPGCYIYMQEGTALSFSVQDEIIISITYFVEDIREYEVQK